MYYVHLVFLPSGLFFWCLFHVRTWESALAFYSCVIFLHTGTPLGVMDCARFLLPYTEPKSQSSLPSTPLGVWTSLSVGRVPRGGMSGSKSLYRLSPRTNGGWQATKTCTHCQGHGQAHVPSCVWSASFQKPLSYSMVPSVTSFILSS